MINDYNKQRRKGQFDVEFVVGPFLGHVQLVYYRPAHTTEVGIVSINNELSNCLTEKMPRSGWGEERQIAIEALDIIDALFKCSSRREIYRDAGIAAFQRLRAHGWNTEIDCCK